MTNHKEAFELAQIKKAESNLARCYLELREATPGATVQPQAEHLKEFEIWCEGYAASGSASGATFLGKSKGKDFQEAVLRYYEAHPSSSFNPKTLTDWGCHHFDNEMDARRTFG